MTQSKRPEALLMEDAEEAQADWKPKEDLRPFTGEWVALRGGYVVAHDRDLVRLRDHPDTTDDDVFMPVPGRAERV
jgi:hypothetical protein